MSWSTGETAHAHLQHPAAKTRLSRLLDEAAAGEPFVIAKAASCSSSFMPLDCPKSHRRIGFVEGEIALPDDFDAMDADIARLFRAVDCLGRRGGSR